MKVKELIEKLSELDQDRQIFICYDGLMLLSPIPEQRVEPDMKDIYNDNSGLRTNDKCDVGDYLINAW